MPWLPRRLFKGVGVCRLCASLLGLSATIAAEPALGETAADSAKLAEAREEFRAGLALEGAGDYPGALVKYRKVAQTRSTGAVRFHIARCLERLGRLTEALGEYQAALEDPSGSDRDQILELSKAAVEAIKLRLARVVLRKSEESAWTRVSLDGVEIGAAALDHEMPLDPGLHMLELRRGAELRREQVRLAEGERREIRLPPPARLEPVRAAEKPAKISSGGSKALPWILGGVGLGATAAGVVLGLMTNAKKRELERVCYSPDRCPKSAEPLHDEGERLALGTNVAFAAGGACLIGAGVWWLTRPASDQVSLTVSYGRNF